MKNEIDLMLITILPDGVIKTETKSFLSKANHDSAENFLKNVAQKAGGETKREKLAGPNKRLTAGNTVRQGLKA